MINGKKFYLGVRYGNNKWDAVNVTWPFGLLYIQNDLLIIKCNFLFFRKEFILNRSNIISFYEHNGIISRGIIIHHNCVSVPVFIMIFSHHRKEIILFLKTWLLV